MINPNDWILRKAESTAEAIVPGYSSVRNTLECWLTYTDNDDHTMTATVNLSGRGSRAYIVVSFSSSSSPVAARAEAHRFTGAVYDAMIEFEEENGIPCAAETSGPQGGRAFAHGREWVNVAVFGRNALEVLADYFGRALEDATDGPGPGR
jgi:hypothetical protein